MLKIMVSMMKSHLKLFFLLRISYKNFSQVRNEILSLNTVLIILNVHLVRRFFFCQCVLLTKSRDLDSIMARIRLACVLGCHLKSRPVKPH